MLDNVANALQARQQSETKVRQFVADASHELRTPLTAVRGYTELMRMTDFTPDGQRSLARVQSQSERMTALVEDLLLLARLDEGQPLKLSEMALTQLVIEGVSDETVMAPGHNWRLELPEEPVVVNGDASQLRQVLMNLLSNARKHTPPGTTVVTGVGKSPGGAAVVTVTDDGGGIPAEFVDQVFSRFARADAGPEGRGRPGRSVRRGGHQWPGTFHCGIHCRSAWRKGNGDLRAGTDPVRLAAPVTESIVTITEQGDAPPL